MFFGQKTINVLGGCQEALGSFETRRAPLAGGRRPSDPQNPRVRELPKNPPAVLRNGSPADPKLEAHKYRLDTGDELPRFSLALHKTFEYCKVLARGSSRGLLPWGRQNIPTLNIAPGQVTCHARCRY